MPSIIAPRPPGVNHRPAPQPRLSLEMRLRNERRTLAPQLANPARPCRADASAWDENGTQDDARALCYGCPIQAACGTVAVIDEAIILADRGHTAIHAVVSGTRGGVTARARRPAVLKLADRIITDRMARAEQARADAERQQAEAEAEADAQKAGAAA
ncbi:hypothetical protein [Nonomuraea wenchangensis]|uniref:4Fe-4S Wbl-type domain-containing protein n=1 Tax=Nonomuraea wenchangensis TaxID=568860 RepID=A0A1I0LTW4_9ACTN|nr:hypothetical protein [Nonomuraea wenchangensis]SEU46681.1 hypothetical protein SAMN05421811_127116 [Nonomuraea wenchangensis]